METELLPKLTSTRRIYLVFGCLILAAWVALIAWQVLPFAELLGHEALTDHRIPFASHLSAFLLSWFLMTVAMMFPASLPLLIQTRGIQPGSGWSAMLTVAGYLSPWVLFGLVAFLGDSFLHEMTEPGAPLAAASDFIAPAILLAAGVYQLTPFKRAFNKRCKPSKNTGVPQHPTKAGSALRHSLWLGFNCVGSCWSLMLIMFALGHHRLDWMMLVGGITAAERLTPWGSRLSKWVGVALIAWCAYGLYKQ